MGPGSVDRHGVRMSKAASFRGSHIVSPPLWWLCLLLVPAAAHPQQGPPARDAPVTSIETTITVDGVLDEPVWTNAPPIGDLVQRQPVPGLAPTERTRVTLLRDNDNLYIG